MRALVLTGLLLFAFFAVRPEAQRQAEPVRVLVWADGQARRLDAFVGTAGEALAEAGIRLQTGDQLLLEGSPLEPDDRLPAADPLVLQVQRAARVDIPAAGKTLYTTGPTLAQAFWEAQIQLHVSDSLVPEAGSAPSEAASVAWQRSGPLVISVDGQSVASRSAASTVGQALQGAGLALQGLDFSLPGIAQPIPADRHIEIVRVHEEIILEQESLPFETLFQPAPEVEIDQQQVLQVGAFGLQVRRVRVRYQNGVEVGREVESEWAAAEPKARIIGYGTNITIGTIDTPQGSLEYWRAVPAYATSYSPCRLGTDFCGSTTASGLPLEKGTVGVIRSWYNAMVFSKVYVEGYGIGTVADIGAGLSGQHWIDLGYSDDDWQQWAGQVTIYFLTPVPPPEQILWILP